MVKTIIKGPHKITQHVNRFFVFEGSNFFRIFYRTSESAPLNIIQAVIFFDSE